MNIKVLGAGTAIPVPGFSPASLLLSGNNCNALIDIGPGTLQRSVKSGVDFMKLQTIFLTHLHSDHTLDLITFLQANGSNFTGARSLPLQIYGCIGTKNWYDKVMVAFEGIAPISYSLDVIENGQNNWVWEEF